MSIIFEMARRACDAGLSVTLEQPLADVPAVILGVALDPQLVAIYQVSNGLTIDEFSIMEIREGKDCDLVDINTFTREDLDTLTLLNDVLLWGYVEIIQVYITSIPSLADAQGRQPVVMLDLNDEPYISPLASTVHRALEVIVQHCILLKENFESCDPLPYEMADVVVRDTRLMQLIDDGAFHALGVDVEEEWLDKLRAAREPARPGERCDDPAP